MSFLEKEQIDKIIKNLKSSEKKSVIYGLGTFILKPARKGKINGTFGGDGVRYKKRVVFKPSETFKKSINE